MDQFLQHSKYIDWNHPQVFEQAKKLAKGQGDAEKIARACFYFVRDEIKHSLDYQLNPVTCKASDVLKHGTGYCYAKSHLLAALLRANSIPAALCYQRLTIDSDQPPYCLHGLNAVFLEAYGWYRIDPRGNRIDVNAAFSPPLEQLAFQIKWEGEADLTENYSEPLQAVTDVLEKFDDYAEVLNNLPDIE